MAELKNRFVFSAQCLQAFADCERRFELRYIEECRWPAIESEPYLVYERHMENGRRFHQAAHRHFLGIEPAGAFPDKDVDLLRWWNSFVAYQPDIAEGSRYPEQTLLSRVGGRPVIATFDLIVIGGGRLTIYDWKTYRKSQPRETMQRYLQTRVYPFVAAQAGAELNSGKPIPASEIEMIYWYAEFPDKPESFVYSEYIHQADGDYLAGLINRIDLLERGSFEKTKNEKQCWYCTYRSLCERGGRAGSQDTAFEEIEATMFEDDEPILTLDDVEAIEFS